MCTEKMKALSYIGVEKITFPHKSDVWTDIRTDISNYRVASLLIITVYKITLYTNKRTNTKSFQIFFKNGHINIYSMNS